MAGKVTLKHCKGLKKCYVNLIIKPTNHTMMFLNFVLKSVFVGGIFKNKEKGIGIVK